MKSNTAEKSPAIVAVVGASVRRRDDVPETNNVSGHIGATGAIVTIDSENPSKCKALFLIDDDEKPWVVLDCILGVDSDEVASQPVTKKIILEQMKQCKLVEGEDDEAWERIHTTESFSIEIEQFVFVAYDIQSNGDIHVIGYTNQNSVCLR